MHIHCDDLCIRFGTVAFRFDVTTIRFAPLALNTALVKFANRYIWLTRTPARPCICIHFENLFPNLYCSGEVVVVVVVVVVVIVVVVVLLHWTLFPWHSLMASMRRSRATNIRACWLLICACVPRIEHRCSPISLYYRQQYSIFTRLSTPSHQFKFHIQWKLYAKGFRASVRTWLADESKVVETAVGI